MNTQSSFIQPSGYGVRTAPRKGNADIYVFWLILFPAAIVCLILYLTEAVWGAVYVAAIALILAVMIAPQVGLYGYFAWQAFDPIFISSESAIFTPAKALAPFLLVLFVLRVGRTGSPMLVSRPFVITMLLFGFYGFIGALVAYQPLAAVRYAGQIVVQAALVIMAVHMLNTRQYVGRLIFATVVGGVVAALLILLPGGLVGGTGRATMGEFGDPNTTAMALAIALAAIPAAWVYTRWKVFYPLYIIAVPVIFIAVLQTGSRAGLLSVFCAFAFGVLLAKGAGILKRVLIAAVFTLTLGYVFMHVMHTDVLDPASRERIEEFVRAGGEPGGNVRLDIWKLALETYAKEPIMGFGFGNTAYALQHYHGWYRDIHSSYLGALVDGGPVGFLLFGFGLWLLTRCVRGTKGTSAAIPATIMLILLLVSCLTLTIHFSKWFWVPATICLLLAEQAKREQDGKLTVLNGYVVQSDRQLHGGAQ